MATKSARKTNLATRKKVEKNDDLVVESPRNTKANNSTSSSLRSANSRRLVIGILAVILIAGLLYLGRSLFIAAIVNGQPISRFALIRELEKQSGQQTLNTLVTKTLINQEASKQGVDVSKKEIDDEIKKIESNLQKQGQKLDQVLQLQGLTKESLAEQIRYQKLIDKMIGKNITVSDKEIEDYIAKNKDAYPEGTKPDKNTVRDQLKRQKLNEKVQTWLQDLNKKAKVEKLISF